MGQVNMGGVASLSVPVDMSGNYTRPPTVATDGSMIVTGSNGTARATAANPLNTALNGVNGTGLAAAANPVPTRNHGSASIATGQVSVGVTSTQIVAARAGRVSLYVTNLGTVPVFVGVTGVSAANGFFLPGVVGSTVEIPTQAAVFGIAAQAQSVAFLETF